MLLEKSKLLEAEDIPLSSVYGSKVVKHHIYPNKVAEYHKRIKAGEKIEPILVRKMGDKHLIVNGHHRVLAHRLAGKKTISADFHHVNNESINEREVTLDYHEQLNSKLFDGEKLKSDVRERLLKIADAWIDFSMITSDVIHDITFTGGNANYNYTPYSDIDVHVIIDKSKIPIDRTFLDDHLKDKKALWLAKHHITVKGIPVELYAQDISEKFPPNEGVYSLRNDEWIQPPHNMHLNFKGNEKLRNDADAFEDHINLLLTQPDSLHTLLDLRKQFKQMRLNSIQDDGEFGHGNLLFKELRNRGVLDAMNKYITQKYDENLSEELYLGKPRYDKKLDINKHDIIHKETNKKVGVAHLKQTGDDHVHVADIHAQNHQAGSFGHSETRSLLRSVKSHYPTAKSIGGWRISGARNSGRNGTDLMKGLAMKNGRAENMQMRLAEDAPTNSMGGSSAASGPVQTYDPQLQAKKTKFRTQRHILRRKVRAYFKEH